MTLASDELNPKHYLRIADKIMRLRPKFTMGRVFLILIEFLWVTTYAV